MLYGLVPLTLVLDRPLRRVYVAYVALGFFVYANFFQVAKLLPMVRVHQITLLHLLSLACLGSVYLFVLLRRFGAERAPGLEGIAEPMERLSCWASS